MLLLSSMVRPALKIGFLLLGLLVAVIFVERSGSPFSRPSMSRGTTWLRGASTMRGKS